MKTAMQSLIEEMDSQIEWFRNAVDKLGDNVEDKKTKSHYISSIIAIRDLKVFIKKSKLEAKEKQQMTGLIVTVLMEGHNLPYGIEYLGRVADAEIAAEKIYNKIFTH